MDCMKRSVDQARADGVNPRACVVINPGNPVGSVLTHEQLTKLVIFCKQVLVLVCCAYLLCLLVVLTCCAYLLCLLVVLTCCAYMPGAFADTGGYRICASCLCHSVSLSVCLSVSLSVCLSVCLFCLSVCLSSLSVYLSIFLSFCLLVCLFVCPSSRFSVCVFVCVGFFVGVRMCLCVYIRVLAPHTSTPSQTSSPPKCTCNNNTRKRAGGLDVNGR